MVMPVSSRVPPSAAAAVVAEAPGEVDAIAGLHAAYWTGADPKAAAAAAAAAAASVAPLDEPVKMSVVTNGVEVVPWGGGTGSETYLVTTRAFGPGELVGQATGLPIHAAPSIFTVQASATEHVNPEFTTLEKANHSCAPNCEAIVAADPGGGGGGTFALRTLVDIPSGTPLSFDYCTTEWSMAAPFACECGEAACRRSIQGFAHLAADQALALLPRAAAHIQALHADASLE